ncbi:hypothetical protein H1S01_13120 [Heliobacterium chlorum]|uniref:YitT family protein n=1 Tax=Heliobacterium chlorum TaxID=2698 RepID=A0ABR7T3V8_HELCL|nr:hypothetical protein [Heliobacterium chlorum]MBC9785447.1 hypothetical protein [Heliobacterium chlorum]
MDNYLKRFIHLLIGLFLYAIGVVITMKANLGFAPWEVFHWGVGNTIGMTIGNVSILTGLFICVLVVLMGEKLGLGTILNMILIGVFIDLLLSLDLIPQISGFFLGALVLIAGLFTISFGSYFYIHSGFGAGPRDSLMVALKRKTNLPVGLCRGLIEGSVVLTGWLLGGPVGIGTVLAAFGISFCIQIVFSLMRFEATSVKHETIDVTQKNLMKLFNR